MACALDACVYCLKGTFFVTAGRKMRDEMAILKTFQCMNHVALTFYRISDVCFALALVRGQREQAAGNFRDIEGIDQRDAALKWL